MKTAALIAMAATCLPTLAITSSAHAGSTFYIRPNQEYRSVADSPFASLAGSDLMLENFESGLLNTPGVTANHGHVKSPGWWTDSVDADDGAIDGVGRQGHSFASGNNKSIIFTFSENAEGALPTMAGLVWTDGVANSRVIFAAWDAYGELLGRVSARVGDLMRNGRTAEDRFFGVSSDTGISRIQIVSNFAGFEIDHLQFAYSFAVVPVPPAVALGLAGLAGVVVLQRKRRAKKSA